MPDYIIKNGVSYRLLKDHLGSVRLVLDIASNTIVQELAYDEFGQVTKDTRPGFQPFGYAGGLYDPDTQLVHFGAREYDAAVGRWLTKDPIGFGDSNLYGYVVNDPVNLFDPNGLDYHHLFPRSHWRRSGMSSDVKDYFDSRGVDTPGRHGYSGAHADYNKRTGLLFKDYCERRGINPDDITLDQARDFMDILEADPKVQEFNDAMKHGSPPNRFNPFDALFSAIACAFDSDCGSY